MKVWLVNELVEVAVRALSPGINDPFTAMTCIDRLGASLTRLARRKIPSPCRCDGDGRLRHHAEMIRRGAREAFPEPSDNADLDERYRRVVDALTGAAKDTGAAVRAWPRPSGLTPDRESRAGDAAAV